MLKNLIKTFSLFQQLRLNLFAELFHTVTNMVWRSILFFFHAVHLAFHGRASFPSIHSITKQLKSAVNGICPPRLFVWKLVNSVMWTQKYSRDRALNFLPPLFYLLNYINNTKIFTVSLKSNGKSLMRWWVHELSLGDSTVSMPPYNIKTAGHN